MMLILSCCWISKMVSARRTKWDSGELCKLWDKLVIDTTVRSEWTSTFPGKYNYQASWWLGSVTLPPINKRFAWILFFEAYDKAICGIAGRFQQHDIAVHHNIQDVFVKLCNWHNCDEYETSFKLGKTFCITGSVSYNSRLKLCVY